MTTVSYTALFFPLVAWLVDGLMGKRGAPSAEEWIGLLVMAVGFSLLVHGGAKETAP